MYLKNRTSMDGQTSLEVAQFWNVSAGCYTSPPPHCPLNEGKVDVSHQWRPAWMPSRSFVVVMAPLSGAGRVCEAARASVSLIKAREANNEPTIMAD